MLFFFYFHLKIGPKILTSIPKLYHDYVNDEDLEQIKRLMDAANEGFFFHTFNPQLKTVNYFFFIESPWARGRMEMLMISQIVQESNPDLAFYERELTEFVTEFQKIPNIYRGIYIDYMNEEYRDEIEKYYELIREKLTELAKRLQQAEIQTKGEIVSMEKITTTKSVRIPSLILENLQNQQNLPKNCFVFYRLQKETYEILLIPVESDKFLKVSIYLKAINAQTLKEISQIVIQNNTNLIHSSGLCTQGSLCIYEVYLKYVDDNFIKELETN